MPAQPLRNRDSSACRSSTAAWKLLARCVARAESDVTGRDPAFEPAVLARLQAQHEHSVLRVDLVWSAIKKNLGRTRCVVETLVAKLDPAAIDGRIQHVTATRATKAAYFKDIGKIDTVEKIDLDFDRRADVVCAG